MVKLAALTPRVAIAVAPLPLPLIVTSGTVLWTPPAVVEMEDTMPPAMLAGVTLLLTRPPTPPTPVPRMVSTSLMPCWPFRSSVAPAVMTGATGGVAKLRAAVAERGRVAEDQRAGGDGGGAGVLLLPESVQVPASSLVHGEHIGARCHC